MKPKLKMLPASFLLVVFSFMSLLVSGQTADTYTLSGLSLPTIASDKEDYAPGETAVVTGRGWTLDDSVVIRLEEYPVVDSGSGYQSIEVRPDGSWEVRYPIEQWHVGVTFTISAHGMQSGYKAVTVFSDGTYYFKVNGLPPGTYTPVKYNYLSGAINEWISFEKAVVFAIGPKDGTYAYFSYPPSIVSSVDRVTYLLTTVTSNGGVVETSTKVNYSHMIKAISGFYDIWGTYVVAAPVISSITPGTKKAGEPTFALTVTGSNFLPASKVYVDGQERSTAYSSSSSITAMILASDLATGGIKNITVVTPAPGGGASNAVGLTVTASATSFSNLASATIEYGTNTTVLSGKISCASGAVPTGAVTINLDGVTQQAVIDPLTGAFSGSFATSSLPVASSPYSIAYTYGGGEGFEPNQGAGLLTVAQAPLTIKINNSSRVYGDVNPLFVGTYSGEKNGEVFSVAGSAAAVAGSPVGYYDVVPTVTGATLSNYTVVPVNGILSITRRPITVTADARQKTYGDPDPVLTWQVTEGNLVGSDTFIGSITRDGGHHAGAYVVRQGSLSLDENYNLAFREATFTIQPRPVTVSVADAGKTYGDPDPELVYAVTEGSLLEGDGFAGSLARDEGEEVGAYAIRKGTLTLGSDYSVNVNDATLQIDPRRITIAADANNKTYGDPDPVLTYTVTSGSLVPGDAFAGSLSRQGGEGVGTYAISLGSVALNSNYAVEFVGSSMTITSRPVTVAAEAKSKIYGDPDPELTYHIMGGSLVAGDAFTGSLERVSGEMVGQYAITGGNLALNPNYDLTITGASLLIQRRPASITIKSATKVYGDKDPDITPGLSGFLESDHITAQYNRVAGENVADGPYAIAATLEPAAALANYDITSTTAYLTITPRKIKVGAKPKGKLAGDPEPSLEYEVVSGGEFLGSENITGALERDPGEDRGNYPIKRGSLALGPNYELEFQGAAFTIYAKPVVALSIPEPTQVGTASSILATIGPDVFEPAWQYTIPSPCVVTRSENGLTINSPTPVVYAVSLKYKDGVGVGHETPKVYAVFFDPSAGFVTGSGWINSKEGAFVASKGKSGKANFGFVSKYEKGKTVPTGNTEFQFQAADMTFKSTAYEYLVIGGAKAQYKGAGTINGTGDYGFMLTAIDDDGSGPADKFRIRIWDKAAGLTVYDNQAGDPDDAEPTTVIGGGAIVIHTTTKGKTTTTSADARAPEVGASDRMALTAFPNPSASSFNVLVQSDNPAEPIIVRVLDLYGRTVEVVSGASNGQILRIGSTYRPGIYFIEMIQGTRHQQVKLLKQAN